jgi:hypothetical protein
MDYFSVGLVELVMNTSNMRVTTTDEFGYTALHYATQYKSLEVSYFPDHI